MKPLRTLALLAAIAALSGCGYKAGLDRPPPRFGEAHRKYEADQRAAAEEKAKKEKARQTVTIPTTAPTTSSTPTLPSNSGTDLGASSTNPPVAPPK